MSVPIRRGTLAAVAAAALVIPALAALAPAQAAPVTYGATTNTITTAFGFNPGLKLLDTNGANTGAAEPSLDVDAHGTST